MWYGIRTRNKQEEEVRRQMRTLAPDIASEEWKALYCVKKKRYLGKWYEERERFLPDYMFLVTDHEKLSVDMDGTGNRKESLESLYGLNPMLFVVGNEEARVLMELTKGKDEVAMSYGVIRQGILTVSQGALKGMEARVKRIDRHKRKGYIAMKIGGEEELAEIGLEITEKT